MTNIQSILFDKNKFTLKKCILWLLKHNHKFKKVDITEKYYRFRQFDPNKNHKYFTKDLENGIKFIIKI